MNVIERLLNCKYKKGIIILGIILLVCLLFVLMGRPTKENPSLGKINVRETPQKIDYLEVISKEPTDNDRLPKGDHKIKITFNKPLKEAAIQYRVQPDISLSLRVFDHSPNSLYIFPDKKMWEKDIKYTVVIEKMESKDGSTLKGPITHNYYYILPENQTGGEAWMGDANVDKEDLRDYLQGNHDYWEIYGETPPDNYEEIFGTPYPY